MRQEWVDRLSKPYGEDEWDAPDRVTKRLGLSLPAVAQLSKQIYEDLDPQQLGIGWWAESVDTKRRILIGDHLLQSIGGVSRNLIEAKLHILELDDYLDRESQNVNDSLIEAAGTPHYFGRPHNALSELVGNLGDIHAVGFLRAIGSALDCLAATSIAVLALPCDVFRSTWGRFRHELKRGIASDQVERSARQVWSEYKDRLTDVINGAGPDGWLEWVLQARNLLVHRPRRVNIRLIDFEGPPIWLRDRMYRRAKTIAVLWRDPSRSEVEALREGTDLESFVLVESATETISGILESSVSLVELAGRELIDVWDRRRANPEFLPQPALAQWKDAGRRSRLVFKGYKPGSVPTVGLDTMIQHPSDAKRMEAADLLDPRTTWEGSPET